ncbi:hatching enzyme 1.2-like [Nelusetta ayraudi]|uniref:hatching enzyme 1.2-like n=1 Tax=Nelusetta ayraudi TaxID=303726 RepID=UPI003F703CE4
MTMKTFDAVFVLLVATSLQAKVQPPEQDSVPEALDMTSKILKANENVSQPLVEGDVVLSRERNAIKCSNGNCKWKKSDGLVKVPYSLSSYFYESERKLIFDAMDVFHQKTCVRFVPYIGQRDYLKIESKMGCWSTVGRNGGQQLLSLSVYGCMDRGIIQHELLHALGFHHEHNRSDRDEHVRINWENVPEAKAHDFNKKDTDNLDTPYDYTSVMHYGRTYFTVNHGQETITPIPDPSVEIGQRDDMSDIDLLRVNKLYGCDV